MPRVLELLDQRRLGVARRRLGRVVARSTPASRRPGLPATLGSRPPASATRSRGRPSLRRRRAGSRGTRWSCACLEAPISIVLAGCAASRRGARDTEMRVRAPPPSGRPWCASRSARRGAARRASSWRSSSRGVSNTLDGRIASCASCAFFTLVWYCAASARGSRRRSSDLMASRMCAPPSRERGRVGAHVGDVTVLVEALRDLHGAPRAEAQLAVGLLLQRRGGERRRRLAWCRASRPESTVNSRRCSRSTSERAPLFVQERERLGVFGLVRRAPKSEPRATRLPSSVTRSASNVSRGAKVARRSQNVERTKRWRWRARSTTSRVGDRLHAAGREARA